MFLGPCGPNLYESVLSQVGDKLGPLAPSLMDFFGSYGPNHIVIFGPCVPNLEESALSQVGDKLGPLAPISIYFFGAYGPYSVVILGPCGPNQAMNFSAIFIFIYNQGSM